MLSLSLSFIAAVTMLDSDLGSNFHAAPNRQTVSMKVVPPKTAQSSKRTVIPWKGHFSAQNYDSTTDQVSLDTIKKNLRTSILKVPRSHTQALQSLEIKNQKHASRGLANSKKIILHTASIKTEKELQAVFIHELGHVVDLGKHKGQSGQYSEFWDGNVPVYSDDVSLKFYRLSWKDAKTRKSEAERADFISGYAMTSPFEDFAESYLFYRLHGDKFRNIAQSSDELQAKYDFMKTYIFGGIEYQKNKKNTSFVHNLIWDATLVKF